MSELKVGDMVYVSDIGGEYAKRMKENICELRGVVDGKYIVSDCGNMMIWKYAVPVEPEKPEVVDVEVVEVVLDVCEEPMITCPYCNKRRSVYTAERDPHYAGIVWKTDDIELINNETVMWRGENTVLHSSKPNNYDSKLERASKVRFEKKGGE